MATRKAEALSAALALACVLSLSAAEYTLKAGLTGQVDLTSPDSYEGGVAPKAGDMVALQGWVLGKGYTHITNSIAADPASWALLQGLAAVTVNYGDTFALVVDGEDAAYDLGCKIFGSSTVNSKFVKLGSKRLNLKSCDRASGNAFQDYKVAIEVLEGTLALPNKDVTGSSSVELGDVYIGKNGTLVTAAGKPSSGTTGVMTVPCTFGGEGLVTNESTEAGILYDIRAALNTNATFTGASGGPIRLRIQRNFTLTVTNATMRHMQGNEAGGGAVFATDDFQNLGTGSFTFGSGGGTYRYVGTGPHTFDRTFSVTVSPATLDGGPAGGLTFAGQISPYSSTVNQNIFCFAGDGDVPCAFSGKVVQYVKNDVIIPYYMIKRGKGTWSFNGSQAVTSGSYPNLCGTFAVEAGTLEYGSMAKRGVNCALGLANACYGRVAGAVAGLTSVDYAYLLGATNAAQRAEEGEARFVYTGSASVQVTSRRIAVQNDAAIGFTQAKRFRWADVRTEGAGAKTLALEAPADATGELFDVVDSQWAPISVEKRGAGVWRLAGTNAVHGTLAAKGGTLVVENPVPTQQKSFSWFRLIVKETAATCARTTSLNGESKAVSLAELGFFDADGTRYGIGIADAASEADIVPGTAQFGDTNRIYSLYKTSKPTDIFDNMKQSYDLASGNPPAVTNWGDFAYATLAVRPVLADEETWWPMVVCRLPTGTPEIVSWDFVTPSADAKQITAARLQASVDGIHWETVSDVDEVRASTASWQWASNGDAWATGQTAKRKVSEAKGFAFSHTASSFEVPELGNVSVAVESDAVVRFEGVAPTVTSLAVSATSGGTVSNAAFAAAGTLEIGGLGKGELRIPMNLSETTDFKNIEKWTLTSGGQTLEGKREFAVGPDGITVFAKGMVLIFR